MAQDNIPKNQIKSRNTIEQREHEDAAAARRVILVDIDGNVSPASIFKLVNVPYDAWTVDYPTAIKEVYKFRTTDELGPVVATVSITYTDATKEFMAFGVRTYP